MVNRREFLGIAAGAGAVLALALSITPLARAQHAQPDAAPLTEVQTAGVKRLKEVIEVLNTGDYATELGAKNYGYGFATRARRADRPLVGHGGNSSGQCTEFGELKDTLHDRRAFQSVDQHVHADY